MPSNEPATPEAFLAHVAALDPQQCESAQDLQDMLEGVIALARRLSNTRNAAGPDGVALIAAERRRQVEIEGFTAEHDDHYQGDQLRRAASSYLNVMIDLIGSAGRTGQRYVPMSWPWNTLWWKPSTDPVRNLVRAGALIAAEIDRLERLKKMPPLPEAPASPTQGVT